MSRKRSLASVVSVVRPAPPELDVVDAHEREKLSERARPLRLPGWAEAVIDWHRADARAVLGVDLSWNAAVISLLKIAARARVEELALIEAQRRSPHPDRNGSDRISTRKPRRRARSSS